MLHNFSFFRRSWILGLIPLFLSTVSCGRYQARHELELNRYFAQITQRVDRRWLGNDRFFENNLMGNPNPEVREWCAVALGRIASPRALPMLYRALHAGDAAVRAAAAFSIGEIIDRELPGDPSAPPNSQAVGELRLLLQDPSISVQMRAIEALGKIGSVSEAAAIIQRLERFQFRSDGSPVERTYAGLAITALVRLQDRAAQPILRQLAKASDPEIRRRAFEAMALLEQIPPSPASASAAPNSQPSASLTQLQEMGLSSDASDPGPVESLVTDTISYALAASHKNSTIAIVETTRGTLEIELFREDAPLTAAHFILMAERGSYSFTNPEDWRQKKSGFVFEQILPSERIAGDIMGTPMGFGWSLNGEINMRPFERGSVGLSIDRADPSRRRLFIALAPLPYLDGVDTCFGRVISGMPVADRMGAGDKILHIRINDTISTIDHVKY